MVDNVSRLGDGVALMRKFYCYRLNFEISKSLNLQKTRTIAKTAVICRFIFHSYLNCNFADSKINSVILRNFSPFFGFPV